MSEANPGDKNLVFESSEPLSVVSTFDDLSLKEDLLQGMHARRFKEPFAIQQRIISPIIQGRNVIAQAPPRTGKTAAYSIGILQSIDAAIRETQALVLSPTRQLATQIQSVVLTLGAHMNVQCCACVGKTPFREDIKKLESGQQIVSGTTGRVLDLLQRRKCKWQTQNVKILILDEADQLLGEGSKDTLFEIYQHLPPTTQVVLLSATIPDDVLEITAKFMTDPIRILIKPGAMIPEGIRQFFKVGKKKDGWKFGVICDLHSELPAGNKAIIFCNSRQKVNELTKRMLASNVTVSSMHGDMEQEERDTIMAEFRNGITRILIATDLWVRGIEFQQASLIINYDIPADCEKYIHRIGCLGRSGRKSVVITLVRIDTLQSLRDIERFYSTQIDEMPANFEELI